MVEKLIDCKALAVNFDKQKILHDITLSVEAGEIVTLIGPNGSGKTTLFKAIIGAAPLAAGLLSKAPHLKIGYVPQKLHIDETLPMTVRRFMNLPANQHPEAISEALSSAGVPGLDKQQIVDLSGGQFRRVLLARALLGKPNLLLLDEATQGLDHRGMADFYRQIATLRKTLGCGIMMISHELHVVMRETDRVICLNGHICCQGKPEIVSNSDEYRVLFGLDRDNESALYLHDHRLNNHSDTPHV